MALNSPRRSVTQHEWLCGPKRLLVELDDAHRETRSPIMRDFGAAFDYGSSTFESLDPWSFSLSTTYVLLDVDSMLISRDPLT